MPTITLPPAPTRPAVTVSLPLFEQIELRTITVHPFQGDVSAGKVSTVVYTGPKRLGVPEGVDPLSNEDVKVAVEFLTTLQEVLTTENTLALAKRYGQDFVTQREAAYNLVASMSDQQMQTAALKAFINAAIFNVRSAIKE